MKRLLILLVLIFLAWGAVPAGANSIPAIAIDCDSVSFSWSGFPARPVVLNISVTQGDSTIVEAFNTNGKPSGDGTVPEKLSDGPASAEVSWTLRNVERHAGPVTADLSCTTTTTTSPPPSTSTTTSPAPTTTVASPPSTSNANECGPDTLACTGGDADYLVAIGGIVLIIGAMFVALTRPRAR